MGPTMHDRADVIGVVGLGHMGAAFADRALALGLDVQVHDVRPEAVAALVDRGAAAAESVGAMADRVGTIIVCVDSVTASLEIASAAAAGARLRQYVETSTVGPAAMARIVTSLPGVAVIDAPVSGGPRAIRSGTLSTYLAGDPDAIDALSPWLASIASTRLVVGERPGMAQIAKLVNNAISLSSMVISCEAIAVGVAAGVPAEILLEAVNAGTGRNSATLSKIPASILTRRFDYGGPVGLAQKDLELYRELAASVGVDEESTVASAQASIVATIGRLGPAADYSEMMRVFEAATGVEVRAASSPGGTALGGADR